MHTEYTYMILTAKYKKARISLGMNSHRARFVQ